MQLRDSFSSNKPYLFRAIYEWLLDNEATPYIVVDTTKPFVDVPQEHIQDNQIVLNVNPSAVQGWSADNQAISFSARFAGVPRQIYVPMNALKAVCAKENGLGMVFSSEDDDIVNGEVLGLEQGETEQKKQIVAEKTKQTDKIHDSGKATATKKQSSGKKTSHLKIVK